MTAPATIDPQVAQLRAGRGIEGVVPTLAELIALRAAAQGGRPAQRGRHGTGQAPSPQRGRGMEYAESREYARGDDARHVDWRLTARSGRMHTKLFQAERERLTLVVADTAPALYFGTRVRFKSVQAARAGAVAVWAAVGEGGRVAALRGSSTEAAVRPAGGTRGALRVLDALARWYAQPPADDAGLPDALSRARRLLRPGSRLVVLADPASLDGIADATWAALSLHHETQVLLIDDPLEREPPPQRLPMLAGGRRIDPDLADPAQRRRWDQAFSAVTEQAAARLRARGVRVCLLSTDAPSQSWRVPERPRGGMA